TDLREPFGGVHPQVLRFVRRGGDGAQPLLRARRSEPAERPERGPASGIAFCIGELLENWNRIGDAEPACPFGGDGPVVAAFGKALHQMGGPARFAEPRQRGGGPRPIDRAERFLLEQLAQPCHRGWVAAREKRGTSFLPPGS